jgi:hypothetical protein
MNNAAHDPEDSRHPPEDPRREFLIRLLAAGAFATGAPAAWAQVFGRRPEKLPAGRSIYETIGAVRVDGKPADTTTPVGASSRLSTGPGAQAIFVVGADAFLLRENSDLQLKAAKEALIDSMRLVTGAVLSVFGSGEKKLATPDAVFGIRGTGLYVEAQGERTYGCTCYGEVLISAADDAKVNERIVSRHHDAPRYIVGKGAARRIVPAPFVNHTDVELALIEALVGRTLPFSLFDEDYGGARRY